MGLPHGAAGRGQARIPPARQVHRARRWGGVRGAQGRHGPDQLHPRLARCSRVANYESPTWALTALRNPVIRTVRTISPRLSREEPIDRALVYVQTVPTYLSSNQNYAKESEYTTLNEVLQSYHLRP